jgi:hypothetical protein
MRDNALDEAIFRTHVEQHRLEDWLLATSRAAKLSNHEERQQELREREESPSMVVEQVQMTVEESVEDMQVVEVTEENFEGDDEESAAERDDVEMRDS